MKIEKTAQEDIYRFSVEDSEDYTVHDLALTESKALELRDSLIEALVDTNK